MHQQGAGVRYETPYRTLAPEPCSHIYLETDTSILRGYTTALSGPRAEHLRLPGVVRKPFNSCYTLTARDYHRASPQRSRCENQSKPRVETPTPGGANTLRRPERPDGDDGTTRATSRPTRGRRRARRRLSLSRARTRAVDDGRDRGARAWTIARATRRRLEEWLGRCARARVGAVDDGTTDGGRW